MSHRGKIYVYSQELGRVVTKEERDAALPPSKPVQAGVFERHPERGHWKHDPVTRKLVPVQAKVERKTHFVHTDEIPPTESYATAERKMFTSQKKYEAHLRAHKMTIKEPGMDRPAPKKSAEERRREINADVAEAVRQLQWGEVPLTEQEKELWKKEQRMFEEYKKRQR